ncbi:hypothetical protein ACIHCX_37790 [Streptomyces sp. NPDC052043]|uniref:hypothetical protein n=1 Tax=Streptomyces sp. NPDC052043 TaxID=3365684 RepID=UPI0037CE60CE
MTRFFFTQHRRTRRPRVLLVKGGAGAGKTALLGAVARQAHIAGARVLTLPALRADARQLTGTAPTLLCVDDVHRAGPRTLSHLRRLARHTQPAPLVTLGLVADGAQGAVVCGGPGVGGTHRPGPVRGRAGAAGAGPGGPWGLVAAGGSPADPARGRRRLAGAGAHRTTGVVTVGVLGGR